ncbi:hypothetical protein LY01_00758 [Nonlabens xylanidelens]|uniref:Uncharacterized protein n=2 Tax=Nonlabens xylanidelens TaxID=191564 RepID=A0A2S6IRN2_9FLAO|nr:hypothetical protein [Nonlabens xylanidelens]PPK96933.1 hypothetical protein LY01_00758 [Nonlabens xylanidelens]
MSPNKYLYICTQRVESIFSILDVYLLNIYIMIKTISFKLIVVIGLLFTAVPSEENPNTLTLTSGIPTNGFIQFAKDDHVYISEYET